MAEAKSLLLESDQQMLRLERFIGTGAPVMGFLGLLILGIWQATGNWVLLPIGGSLVAWAIVFHFAARLVRRGRAQLALSIETAGNLYFVLLCSFLLGSGVLPVLVLLALWPVMVALPYARGRDLVWRMAASVLAAGIASALALRPNPFDVMSTLPAWVLPGLNLLCIGPYVGFSCWMLWHYNKGLNETVEELRESERVLEQKVEQRTHELAQKNDQLLKADTIKSRFLSNASHELRTPLTSIRAFSELLADDASLDEQQREFARIINEESERLVRLTTNLLDLSRIETGSLVWHPRTLDLRPEIDDLVRAYRPLAEQKNIELTSAVDRDLPAVEVDPDGLHQVLANLLTNALKFTERGSIRIAAALRGGRVQVTVSDTGPGIGPEDQERVFEAFYQAGNILTEKPSGAGLGLAICKEILAQHDSQLRLTSELGRGSSFEFELAAAT